MAAIKLKIVVDHLDNVLLQFDQIKVYRSTTGRDGVYSEITGPGTRVDLVAGTTLYEHIDATGDPSYWYKFSFYNSTTTAEGTLSDPLQGTGRVGVYATIQDIRDEGVPDTVYSDTRVNHAIELASRYIERVTGRWFEARTRTFRVKARNTGVCFLEHPIVSVSAINIVSGRGADMDRDEVDLEDVLVFNRHLTQGLMEPDDRDAPRLEFENLRGLEYPGRTGLGRTDAEFPHGSQVVEVTGRFGYTELSIGDEPGETSDGSQVPNSEGVTPQLIEHVCRLLVMRELAPMGNAATRSDWRDRHRLEQEKTDDQMYKLSPLAALGNTGNITGDPEIDGILTSYMAPATMGAV